MKWGKLLLVLALGGAGVGFLVANAIAMLRKRPLADAVQDVQKPAAPDT